MKTLLQIVQDICKETGQPRPSLVASATTETPIRMMRMVNRAGKQLAMEHDWQALTTVTAFNPTATQAQAAHPPSDFLRFTSQTQLWDVGNQRPLVGPLSPQKWLRLVVDSQQSIDKYWALLSGVINILPTPATTDSFVYAYQTKNWAQNAALAGIDAFTADDDTPKISDELLILEGIWRWKQAIGLDYAEDMATATRYKEMAIAADRGPRILSLDKPFRSGVPDSFWPGTITP